MTPMIYAGVVESVDDPEGLGRVRVSVPGLTGDTSTTWALPIGTSAGEGVGDWVVPEKGAEVLLLLLGGDPDSPYYVRGNFGRSDVPSESGGSPRVRAFATPSYVVIMDERGGGSFTIRHRPTGDVVSHSGASLAVSVDSETNVTIRSTGRVDISAAVVTIQGRVVAPGIPKPI